MSLTPDDLQILWFTPRDQEFVNEMALRIKFHLHQLEMSDEASLTLEKWVQLVDIVVNMDGMEKAQLFHDPAFASPLNNAVKDKVKTTIEEWIFDILCHKFYIESFDEKVKFRRFVATMKKGEGKSPATEN
ncbi:hypothetical protein RUND412_005754 [Rhizina undulata]